MLSKLSKIKAAKDLIKSVPEEAGIYIFWEGKRPIYIGKAINLRNRLESYFASSLHKKTAEMVLTAQNISFIKVPTEIEALLLEAELIWKYKPKYNQALKDDKHPLYILITKEKYPRVLMAKRSELNILHSALFGPFPSTGNIRYVLKMLRPIFPYATHTPLKKPCLYHQLNLCNPCPSEIENTKSPAEKNLLLKKYRENLRNIKGILSGRIKKTRRDLDKKMTNLSKQEKYEEAALIKSQIQRLDYITSPITPVDIFVENPNLIEDIRATELENLKVFLEPYLSTGELSRIECFDVAHLMGKHGTASMVTFVDGVPDKTLYRHFKIKYAKAGNDPGALSEIAKRRSKWISSWGRSDLIIVDGGKAQVKAFYDVFNKLGIPVVGLSKRLETIVIPRQKDKLEYIEVRPKGPALYLVQRIRDEAHRFARRYHHKLLSKYLLE